MNFSDHLFVFYLPPPVKRLENANEDVTRYSFEGHRELQEAKRPLDHREYPIRFKLEVHGRKVPREAH